MFQIPSQKYWNTWSSKSPAIMEFLPTGFGIKIGAYSFKTGEYTNFPFSKSITLYEHHPDGKYCRLQVEHADTVLELEYFKIDDYTILGKIKTVKNGEWGLRFIDTISFGFEDGTEVYEKNGVCRASKGSYEFAVSLKYKPIRECYSDTSDDLGEKMVELGYYTPMPQSDNPKNYSVMYNLEENPTQVFTVSVANSYEQAKKKADSALELVDEDGVNASQLDELKATCFDGLTKQTAGENISSTEALCDVMAWNTLADKINERIFTSITRFWIDKKFGGWFIWLDDILMHGLMNTYLGDWTIGRSNYKSAMDNAVPAGNFACLMSKFTEWVDRSQPPIISYMVYKYYLITKDRELIKGALPSLKKAFNWWFENRDGNDNGVLEYGSSQIGNGHFNGTKLAAKDEAAMDNSPMYDSAKFIPETNTINMEDIALNSLLSLDGECLAYLAKACGEVECAEDIEAKTDGLKKKIDSELWDAARKLYANKHWDKGFVCPTPTSFYPMAAGIPDEEKVNYLLEHMFDEDEFWTEFPLPSVWAKDEAVNDNVYWRGRAWPPLNYFTYTGLKRCGRELEARKLLDKIMGHFTRIWNEERACYENHNTFTGEGNDSVDTDPFYGWGALYPMMWITEHIDIDPWHGFTFGSITGNEYAIENVQFADGTYKLECSVNKTVLTRDGKVVFTASTFGRFKHFEMNEHYAAVVCPKKDTEYTVEFATDSLIELKVNGVSQKVSGKVKIPKGKQTKIEIWY